MKIERIAAAAFVAALGLGMAVASAQNRTRAPEPERANPAVAPPHRAEPGDFLQVEVLEALPGRPITGARIVRPDGTISLGFYGDLSVVGLTRDEIKIKVIKHLRPFLTDQALGLVRLARGADEFGGTLRHLDVPPVDSDRVFIDDHVDPDRLRAEEHSRKVEQLLNLILWTARNPPEAPRALAPRLKAVEADLDRLIESLEKDRKR